MLRQDVERPAQVQRLEVRLGHDEGDFVLGGLLDALDLGQVGPKPRGVDLRVHDQVEAVDHVFDGHRLAVGEGDALAELEGELHAVGADLEAAGQQRDVLEGVGVAIGEGLQHLGLHPVAVEVGADHRRELGYFGLDVVD